jgi:hypothetical protein
MNALTSSLASCSRSDRSTPQKFLCSSKDSTPACSLFGASCRTHAIRNGSAALIPSLILEHRCDVGGRFCNQLETRFRIKQSAKSIRIRGFLARTALIEFLGCSLSQA